MTRPPLRLVRGAAVDMPRSLSLEGMAQFIIGSAKLFSGDVELIDVRDRKLAEVLFFYGEWPADGPFAVMDNGEFAGVVFVAKPEEPSDQGFDGIVSTPFIKANPAWIAAIEQLLKMGVRAEQQALAKWGSITLSTNICRGSSPTRAVFCRETRRI